MAWAHARTGDRIALAAYLGGSGKFDQAIADFAEKYADQNERDYATLQAAVKDGRAETTSGFQHGRGATPEEDLHAICTRPASLLHPSELRC